MNWRHLRTLLARKGGERPILSLCPAGGIAIVLFVSPFRLAGWVGQRRPSQPRQHPNRAPTQPHIRRTSPSAQDVTSASRPPPEGLRRLAALVAPPVHL